MSLTQTVLIERFHVPDRAKLEQAVRALGFDVTINDFYKPFDCSGFLPCVLNGRKSGFEIYFDSPEEALQNYPSLQQIAANRNCAMTFRWGGDMGECACVLIVSAALAVSFGAVVHYDPDDLVYSNDKLIAEARQAIEYADIEADENARAPLPARRKKPWWKLWG
jgi:hypothetical protein